MGKGEDGGGQTFFTGGWMWVEVSRGVFWMNSGDHSFSYNPNVSQNL